MTSLVHRPWRILRHCLELGAVSLLVVSAPPAAGQAGEAAGGPAKLEARLPDLAGAERAEALARLAMALQDAEPEKALTYGRDAVEMLAAHPAPELEVPLLLALAQAAFRRGEDADQLDWAQKAGAAAVARGDDDGRWQALVQIAEVSKLRGEYAEALDGLSTAREIVERLGEPAKTSLVLGRLGNTYQRQGDFPSAMESLHAALEIQRTIDDPEGMAQVLRDTGRVYESIEDYEQSLDFYQQALAKTRELGDRLESAFNLRNIASIQMHLGHGEEALETALQALAEAEALGDRKLEATLLNNIASLNIELERYSEALAWIARAEPAMRVFGFDRWNAVILSNKGEALTEVGRYREALAALREALAAAESADAKTMTISLHEQLSKTFAALGDPSSALEHHRRFKELHDELFTAESQQRVAELQTRFESAEKDREIAALAHEKELAATEIQRQRTIRNGVLAIAALVFGLAGVIGVSYRLQKKANRELKQAYDDLETTHLTLAEKQAEVHQERAVSTHLREIDRLKDEFLATTSHELRTPLYGITGLVESLLDGSRGEVSRSARADLAMVVASARRLSGLVDDILDFSKLKHHSLELTRRPVDLKALTDVVLTLSRPLIGDRNVELVNAVGPDLTPADADENRLQQILHNLVANAVKFTEAGSVTVSADVLAGADDGQLQVQIADTGIGIAAEHLERIFEAFEQADSSTERRFGGTGLGLAVSRQLVELHGGTLTVESRPGQGSTFTFSLPAAADGAIAGEITVPAAETTAVIADDGDGGTETGSGTEDSAPRILIVDDEPINRRVLANHLAAAGYRLALAGDGEEALRALDRSGQDLILLDVMMPKMSGYEVCRSIRERHSLEELPVIFLTAKSQVSDLITGMDAGANDYLTKPIAKSELLARVQTHLALLEVHRDLQHLLRERAEQLTERQQLVTELEARNTELARFTYTVSHDLKSPLVTIKGFIGLLEQDADTGDVERMRHDIRRIQEAAEKMRLLLDDLLELSRIGRLVHPPEAISMRELAYEAVGLVAGAIEKASVTLRTAPDLPVVLGDRLRLREVYQNLLENAVKYMGDQPEPRIEIGVRPGEPPVFTVRDNGIGVDAPYQEKIFGLFERLDATTKGTGVGLTLVQRIVEVHGGRVWVESEGKGEGSTFCFTIPNADIDLPLPQIGDRPAEGAALT